MIYEIKNGYLTAKINSLGAELISVVDSEKHEYIWSGDDWKYHAPVLFPLCGRVKDYKYNYLGKTYDMLQHGFTRTSEFQFVSSKDNAVTLELCSSEETRKEYPFEFKLVAEYSLEKNKLSAKFTVVNLSENTLPFMIGWHPAFVLEGSSPLSDFGVEFKGDDVLKLRPLTALNFMEKYTVPFNLDGGKYFFNKQELLDIRTYAFEYTEGYAKLFSRTEPHTVTLEWSDNIPYFCLWKLPEDSARYMCLEPWSNLPSEGIEPDDFSTKDMVRLPAGKSEDFLFITTFDKN